MNILYCSLDLNEFNLIFFCISAKEVWEKLETTFEGAYEREELSFQEENKAHPNFCLVVHENEKKKKNKKQRKKNASIKGEQNKEKKDKKEE